MVHRIGISISRGEVREHGQRREVFIDYQGSTMTKGGHEYHRLEKAPPYEQDNTEGREPY